MCGNNLITFLLNRKGCRVLSVTLLMVTMSFFSCGTAETKFSHSTIEHRDGDVNLYRHSLALRFAPRLHLHPDEPFEIIGIIPVFHPEKPIIAYHFFFEDDAILAGRGTEVDHEILWVEYDPVTLKVSDVVTYWHRTVLKTDTCVINAKASQQRPSVCIQWGQHGILPLGWETLTTARPSLELRLHYSASKTISRIRGVQKVDSVVTFRGSYREYLQFTKKVDSAYYVKKEKIIVTEYPEEELRLRFKQTFDMKKEWHWWSPR